MKPDEYDPIFEAMLRQAIRDNIYEEAESVPDNDVLAAMFTISERHDTRMRRLCAREDRREQVRAIMRPLRRVAVAALIAITVLFGALMMNFEVRATVVEVIIEWYEQFTRFVGNYEDPSQDNEVRDWSPSFLPEGYYKVAVYEGDPTIIEYEDDVANLLLFRYAIDKNDLRVDNEESEYVTREIEGCLYYVFTAESTRKVNAIIWVQDGYRFNLSGYLNADMLLEIAKSVK